MTALLLLSTHAGHGQTEMQTLVIAVTLVYTCICSVYYNRPHLVRHFSV